MYQGKMTGNQVGKLFADYNTSVGSAVVNLNRNYNTGDNYSARIGTGNQIDLAFAEINAYRGDTLFALTHQDWGDGVSLSAALTTLQGVVDTPAPILSATVYAPPSQLAGAYNYDASVCFVGSGITYSATNLPAELTIDPATGIITGTAIAGTSTDTSVTATNSSGAVTTVLVTIVIT